MTAPRRKAIWVDPEVHQALKVVAANKGLDIGVIANQAILAWAMKEERKLSAQRQATRLGVSS